jgi:hypothetical protein
MNPFPFRKDPNPDLTRTISEIVAPKGKKTPKGEPKAADPKGDKYGAKPVAESHTRAQLEKLSTTQLRELMKKYERMILRGDKDAARELADIRGLLRSKGAGHALDEASACERAAAARLKAANAEDLEEKPGKAGEKAHKRLHTTIKSVVGEGQEYTAALEAALLALCEELNLDPDALLEDVQTFERERETQGETKKLYDKRAAADNRTAAGAKAHRSIDAKLRHRFKRDNKERVSKELYGKGGKVIRKGTAEYKSELERSKKQRAADEKVRQKKFDAEQARRRRTNPNWAEEDRALGGGYGSVGAYRAHQAWTKHMYGE